jgi:hypothetical protein
MQDNPRRSSIPLATYQIQVIAILSKNGRMPQKGPTLNDFKRD